LKKYSNKSLLSGFQLVQLVKSLVVEQGTWVQIPPTPKTNWCLGLMVRATIMSGRHRFKFYHNYPKKNKSLWCLLPMLNLIAPIRSNYQWLRPLMHYPAKRKNTPNALAWEQGYSIFFNNPINEKMLWCRDKLNMHNVILICYNLVQFSFLFFPTLLVQVEYCFTSKSNASPLALLHKE
jgi:hypothetical protein